MMLQQAYQGLKIAGVYSDIVMILGRELFPENLESFQYGFGFVLSNVALLLIDHNALSEEGVPYTNGKDSEAVWDKVIRDFFDQQ